MNRIKVSVIVPVWDETEGLTESLESLLSQNMGEIEILCVGAEKAMENIGAEQQADRRLRCIPARKKSCGHFLNRGIREATGEYVSFLLPGDTVASEMYAEMVKVSDAESLDFALSDIDAVGGKLSGHRSHYGKVLQPAENRIWTAFPWFAGNGLYRLKFLKKHRIKFSERNGRKLPSLGFLFQVYLRADKAYLVEQPFYRRNESMGSVTMEHPEEIFSEYDAIGSILRREKDLFQKFKTAYAKCCYMEIRQILPQLPVAKKKPFLEKAATFLREMHESGMIDYYDLTPEEHRELSRILFDTERYVEDFLQGKTPRMAMEFLFPYHLVPEGSNVLIYGAGNVGRLIYRQAVHDGYVNIAGIVDRNFEDMGAEDLPVEPLDEITRMDFDYILIAIRGKDAADSVRDELQKMGVPEEKILWDGPSYFRDEFYRNVYFPMLRAEKGNHAPHQEFVAAHATRMKGSIHDHIFPYHLFREGASVALYGAGDIGRKYYVQATQDGYVKIAGIVDRNPAGAKAAGIPAQGIETLKGMTFDYVLITVHGGKAVDAIRETLTSMGIPENKIRWDGETYYRDEFFLNVYFPMLRKIGGDFSNRKQFLDALEKKLRMVIYDHIFPYHLFREGETIAIYGAGDVGRKFYQQAKDYGWVKCVVIVDKNAENIDIPGIPVAPVGALKQFKFDKVLISMTNEKWADEARETLIRMGIADERIKWAGKIYWRENFYKQYWFEYLRFIHEMRRSKI